MSKFKAKYIIEKHTEKIGDTYTNTFYYIKERVDFLFFSWYKYCLYESGDRAGSSNLERTEREVKQMIEEKNKPKTIKLKPKIVAMFDEEEYKNLK